MSSRPSRLGPAVTLPGLLLLVASWHSQRLWCLGGSSKVCPPRHPRATLLLLATPGQAPAAPPDVETVSITMPGPLDGKVGVAIQGGRRTVSRLRHKDAYDIGWRVGDTIVEVNRQPVDSNEAVKAAVKEALSQHSTAGTPLEFKVRRLIQPPDTTRGMLRMTPGTGGELTMSMLELTQSLVRDLPVVVFIDGTLKVPNSNLSARIIEILIAEGVAFKAINCADEKYNPGTRAAVEELAGEYALPQLFAGGQHLGNGYTVQDLQTSGELTSLLRMGGAVDFEP